MNKWTAAIIGGLTAVLLTARVSASAAQVDEAQRILDESGVKGGLIVHVGCGDGKLTAAMRASRRINGVGAGPAIRPP